MTRRFRPYFLSSALSICAVLVAAETADAQITVESVMFQHGADGYSGTFDRRISLTSGQDGATVDSTATSFFIDGDPEDAARDDYLIRFDDILGGAGIPAGAIILDAQLTLRTQSSDASSSADTTESFNVYRLTQGFDSNSTLDSDFGDGDGLFTNYVDGVEPEQGEADFILGTFDHPIGESPMDFDKSYSASVTRAVQSWVDGDTNYGLAVVSDHRDNDNGWGVHSTGSSEVSYRPKLTVTYTTSPNVQVHEFQDGLGGYDGTTDVMLNLVTDTGGTPERDDDTVLGGIDASTESELFLDGNNDGDSYDTPYLIKFADVEALTGRVYKAELLIATGFSSGVSDSGGPYTVHQMLTPFDTTSVYSDYSGDVDDMLAANEIAPEVGRFVEIDEAEYMSMDVTSVVDNWLSGDPNYGFYIGSDGTSDGWQIFTSGAVDPDLAPMLRIYTVPEPTTFVLGVLGIAVIGMRRKVFSGR
ncbi:DNRLRE domain-containing protein [Aeoliella sp.]|uniref:PEP-CTERM sorting domain-containing protein n=1 Tax=Aeoliella sp. TaxID=2795800 RepID=UPI003CCBA9DD